MILNLSFEFAIEIIAFCNLLKKRENITWPISYLKVEPQYMQI